jgi:N-acylneuraminate cytidylyltransferase
MNTIALIPARSGSQRIKDKNIRELAGHPLLAYTIQVAKDSGLFGEHIYIITDSCNYADIAEHYGASYIMENPIKGGQDSNWIMQALTTLNIEIVDIDKYYILRPTSPFRTVEMLRSADNKFNAHPNPILKAVEDVKQHPKKMWEQDGYGIYPHIKGGYHYEPSHTFERLLVQNASLEIRKYGVPMPLDGPVTPFFADGYEGFDINTEDDWILAEALIERGLAKLPEIK